MQNTKHFYHKIIESPLKYGGMVFLLVLIAFFANFRKFNISDGIAEWGQFGDFIGGLINPIFGLLSLIVISETLKSQTKSAKIQEFNTHFFTLLQLHASVLENIDRRVSKKTKSEASAETPKSTEPYEIKGRDCFKFFYDKIRFKSQSEKISMQDAYHIFVKTDGWEIEHYYRTVYHIFKYIKEQSYKIDADEATVKHYYDLAKSQISQYELVMLWLNVQGVKKGKWDALISEKGADIFEHLNPEALIINPPPISNDDLPL